MSRGGLLLRKAREGVELDYVPDCRRRPATARGRRSCRPSNGTRRRPLTIPARPGQRRPRRRRQGSPPHQPPQAVLAGARSDQGRSAAVLRRRRRRAAAAHPRSRDGDETLPARRVGRILLHEARADAAAGVDSRSARSITAAGNVIDFPMIQDRAALMWVINLGCIDSEPVVRDLRRRRSARLPALRSRSRSRHAIRTRARDGAGRQRGAGHAEDAIARKDYGIEGSARLRADRARAGAKAGVDVRESAGAGARVAQPGDHYRGIPVAKRPTGRVLVDYNQNRWGSTLHRCIRRGRVPRRRYPRPSPGRMWIAVSESKTSRSRTSRRASPGSAISGSRC